MLQKIVTFFIVLSLLPAFLYAQEKTILLPDGRTVKHKGDLNNLEVRKPVGNKTGFNNSNNQNLPLTKLSQLSTIDTLSIPGPYGAYFVHYGQDWMVMWFEAPADLNLLQVGFACYFNDTNQDVSVKVVGLNWTKEEIMSISSPALTGYYEALGNGYNDVTAFLDNPDRTGGWSSVFLPPSEIFGNDIWSDAGAGFTITPVPNTVEPPTYQWVDLSILQVPQLGIGDLFGIAIKNNGTTMGVSTIGYWYNSVSPSIPLFKFYADGRLVPGVDYGWWIRPDFSLCFAAVVELTGDRGPQFGSVTSVPSGIDLGPFTIDAVITDDNPGDPPNAGVASAILKWSIDDGSTWNNVTMTDFEPNFTGEIPAQSAGTTVMYYIEATDVASNVSTSSTSSFYIFAPSGAPTLVILNGYDLIDGYPQDYYWGSNIQSGTTTFPHDRWAYGPVPDMLNNYDNIIEICFESPGAYNDSLIRIWLEGDPGRNYFLSGQEWLGARYAYVNQDFQAGDFEYDILGVDYSYNDISYDGTVGQNIPSLVWPQAGTMFGQPLLDLFNSLTPPADSMMYNPSFETGNANWQDAFDVVSGVEVDLWVETRGIDSAPVVDTLATQLHRTLPAGNKIAFLAYDPIALNTAVDGSYPYYNWIGYDEANTPYQIFNWFGIVLDVKNVGGVTPTEFSVAQNYPNPFNPSTTINFSVPQTSKVTLKIYDILGKEVTTLVNETKSPGNYAVDFNASKLASGMYIYTIAAGEYTASKKMMFLK